MRQGYADAIDVIVICQSFWNKLDRELYKETLSPAVLDKACKMKPLTLGLSFGGRSSIRAFSSPQIRQSQELIHLQADCSTTKRSIHHTFKTRVSTTVIGVTVSTKVLRR